MINLYILHVNALITCMDVLVHKRMHITISVTLSVRTYAQQRYDPSVSEKSDNSFVLLFALLTLATINTPKA